MNGFVIKEKAMALFTVHSEGLAMIRHYRNEAPFVERPRAQRCQQLSDGKVDIRNLAVIKRGRVPGFKGRRRVIGFVRVVKMHPQKERRARVLVEPGDGVVHHYHGPAFLTAIAVFAALAIMESDRKSTRLNSSHS